MAKDVILKSGVNGFRAKWVTFGHPMNENKKCFTLEFPQSLRSLTAYCATLAHKVSVGYFIVDSIQNVDSDNFLGN